MTRKCGFQDISHESLVRWKDRKSNVDAMSHIPKELKSGNDAGTQTFVATVPHTPRSPLFTGEMALYDKEHKAQVRINSPRVSWVELC